MFPEAEQRETLRFEGKKLKLFAPGLVIKCFVI